MSPATNSIFIISSAGGNNTALEILESSRDREYYERRGSELMNIGRPYDVEQSGFIILQDSRMEMAGGEFCGNASRAGALVLSHALSLPQFRFSVSGTQHFVKACIADKHLNGAYVQCDFLKLPSNVQHITLSTGVPAFLVDLGGIVHVLIEAPFPDDEASYTRQHREVMDELGLQDRDAVGVNWIQRHGNKLMLHPVVWVRAIDTFFYETSCGSGSIAASFATGSEFIQQPSGKTIRVTHDRDITSLSSEMEIVHVIEPS
tara:strand:+ start:898 stop:1680 length:783 start_codon:yes stop_codon:yes gene_type:complete